MQPSKPRDINIIGWGEWARKITSGSLAGIVNVKSICSRRDESELPVTSRLYRDVEDLLESEPTRPTLVLTGPPAHHEAINLIHRTRPDQLIYCEKPYLIEGCQPKSMASAKVFVNYQWYSSIQLGKFNKLLPDVSEWQSLEVCLYSGRERLRDYSISFDFGPHLYSIIQRLRPGFCNLGLDPSESVEKGTTRHSFHATYRESAQVGNFDISLNYGFENSSWLSIVVVTNSGNIYRMRVDNPLTISISANEVQTQCYKVPFDPITVSLQEFFLMYDGCIAHDCRSNLRFHREAFELSQLLDSYRKT